MEKPSAVETETSSIDAAGSVAAICKPNRRRAGAIRYRNEEQGHAGIGRVVKSSGNLRVAQGD